MRDAVPGELVVVLAGAMMRAIIGNEQSWNEAPVLATVLSTTCHVVEGDEDVGGCVTVFIAGQGFFTVEEAMLRLPDEPDKKVGPTRLRD